MIGTSSRWMRGTRGRLCVPVISVGALLLSGCGEPAPRAARAPSTVPPAVDASPREEEADLLPVGKVRWIAAHQSGDGSWEVGGWDRWQMGHRVSGPRLTGLGSASLDVAATALVVAIHESARDHDEPGTPMRPEMAWGVHALLSAQDAHGAFGDPGNASWPVNQGLALFALAEIAEAHPEPGLAEAVRRGVARVRRSRATEPARWADARAFGGVPAFAWVALASQAAVYAAGRREGPRVSATGLEADPALARDRALVASWIALPEADRTLAKVGLGLHVGVADLAGGPRHPSAQAAAAWLAEHVPVWNATGEGVDALGWWLGTLGVFQVGGEPWKKWEAAIKPAVVDTQRKDGSPCEYKGSWDPVGVGAAAGGRVVMTAACYLIEEIWYRYDKVLGAPSSAPTTRSTPIVEPSPERGLPRRRYSACR